MSLKKLVLGLVAVGVLGWGGSAMAAVDPALNTDVKVKITCQVSTVLLGWALDPKTIDASPITTIANAGQELTWALGTAGVVDLNTAYTSHTIGTNPKKMTLKNWGGGAIKVTVTFSCTTGWGLAAAAEDKFQMRYDNTFDVTTATPPQTALTSGLQILGAMAVGAESGLALELTTPISVSSPNGIAAQTIYVILTGST